MNNKFLIILKTKASKIIFATILSGIGMWITAGIWHNLIMPQFDKSVSAHHDGLGIMLISYFILSFMMVFIFHKSEYFRSSLIKGLFFGAFVGILWVFPHGLTMAAVHNSSIIYEIKNACWHAIEQGIGGIIIFLVIVTKAK